MTQQSWTTPEAYTLDTLRDRGWSYERIASQMGRTVDSVRNKAHKMDRARGGKKPYDKRRTRLDKVDSMAMADELISRGWKCYAPRRPV